MYSQFSNLKLDILTQNGLKTTLENLIDKWYKLHVKKENLNVFHIIYNLDWLKAVIFSLASGSDNKIPHELKNLST